jgi:outer membrane protein assembly factor BamE
MPTSLDVTQWGLYKPEVVQGNFVSREQRQALKLGMARAQVKDILGTPLVASLFHADRWDYVFTIRRQGVAPQSFKLTVQFKGDTLSQIEGDELPSENEFVERLVGNKKISAPPLLQASEEELKKFPPAKTTGQAPALLQPPLPISYPPLEPAAR